MQGGGLLKYGNIYNTSRIVYDIGSVLGNTQLPRLLDALLRFSAISGDVAQALGMVGIGGSGSARGMSAAAREKLDRLRSENIPWAQAARAVANFQDTPPFPIRTGNVVGDTSHVPLVHPASFFDKALAGVGGWAGAGAIAAAAALTYVKAKGITQAAAGYNDWTEVSSGLMKAVDPLIGSAIAPHFDAMAKWIGTLARKPGAFAEGFAQFSSTAISGNNAGAAGMLYDGFVEVAKELPLLGHQLGIAGEAAGKFGRAFGTVVESFIARSGQLAPYSPQIAIAMGRREVAGILGDVREANRLGIHLERLIDSKTNLDRALRDAFLPLKELLAKNLPPIIDAMAKGVDNIGIRAVGLGQDFKNQFDLLKAVMGADAQKMFDLLFDWKKKQTEAMEEELRKRNAEVGGLLDNFKEFMKMGMAGNVEKEPGSRPQKTGALGIPIFKRLGQ